MKLLPFPATHYRKLPAAYHPKYVELLTFPAAYYQKYMELLTNPAAIL